MKGVNRRLCSSDKNLWYGPFFKEVGHSRPLFLSLSFVFNLQLVDKTLPMIGFKLQISGVGSDRLINVATTTAHYDDFFAYTGDKNL